MTHSLSPAIHRAAYAELGLDWEYRRIELREPDLPAFVAGLDQSWRGLSLTMPLKEVAATLGMPDADVLLTGAANTLIFETEGEIAAYNTDIAGLQSALAAAGVRTGPSATVIGSGATARSVVVALDRYGFGALDIVARNIDKAKALQLWANAAGIETSVRTWGTPIDPASGLVVSTIPSVGLEPILERLLISDAPSLEAVFDVVYHPWPTPLAMTAAGAGRTVLSGLDLLVHQAIPQIRLMTGGDVEAEPLLSAARAEILARSGA